MLDVRHHAQQCVRGQALAGLPAVERVGVVRELERKLLGRIAVFHDHRRREIAQQRGQRRFGHIFEDEGLLGFREVQHACGHGRGRCGLATQAQRQVAAVLVDQADRKRNVERLLLDAAVHFNADRLTALAQRERVRVRGGIVVAFDCHDWRAGLAVPAAELREVAAVGIGHGGAEIVAGDGVPIVALEVQVHALAETVAAQQRLVHAHDFGAFFVHRDGVEVVDFFVTVGPYRVGHRASVFRELRLAEQPHVFDALDGACAGSGGFVAGQRGHVSGELLIAEHRQAFLQTQLEPVAASDAVARPVVEVFVADHRFDVGEIHIGGRLGVGQHVLCVEDVQALVFHRAHVEVAHGDDHEAVQIQLEAKAAFVPVDGVDQRIHCVARLAQVMRLDPYLQQLLLARCGLNALLDALEFACHQREQVRRFLERVVPHGFVAAVRQVALRHEIAVGQQHRVIRFRCAQRDGVDGHHVRAVEEVGDLAEALGLALCEEVAVGNVQAHQRRVRGGIAVRGEFQRKAGANIGRYGFDGECVAGSLQAGQRLAVDCCARQLQPFTCQHERLAGIRARQAHAVDDTGALGHEIDLQGHFVNAESGCGVVLAVNRDGGIGAQHR